MERSQVTSASTLCLTTSPPTGMSIGERSTTELIKQALVNILTAVKRVYRYPIDKF
jgi:hypothetical protein